MRFSYVILLLGTIKYNQGQYIGDKCFVRQKAGVCKPISQCQSAIQDISKRVRPSMCGLEGRDPIVCCPTSMQSPRSALKIGTKSKEKCRVYRQLLNRPSPYVVSGKPAKAGQYPHMAALGYGEDDDIQWLCGGTLISEKFILTAAHCVHTDLGIVKVALLGTINLKKHNQGGYPQMFSIVKTFRHPDYTAPSTYNDIALLELNTTVDTTRYVIPACISSEGNLTVIEAIGWGRQEYAGETSDNLLKVDLRIYDHNSCSKSYSTVKKRFLQKGILKESQLCAGGGPNESKDTCQGDSGGPLHKRAVGWTRTFSVIGVTSFGKNCGVANIPSVYTKVSHFVPWIESIVWP